MKIRIPIYNQIVYIDNAFESDDFKAIVEFNPITLKYNPKYWNIKELSHECYHITNQIAKRCLIDLDYDNDEALAYLYSFIFNKLYELTIKSNKL